MTIIHRGDERGMTPVVGISLLVGLLVVLAGVVASVGLGFGATIAEPAPSGKFSFAHSDAGLTVTYEGGQTIDAERLSFAGADPDDRLAFDVWGTGDVGAGDSVSFPDADGNERVHLVYTTAEGRSYILGEWVGDGGEFAFLATGGVAAFEAEAFTGSDPGATGATWSEQSAGAASDGSYLLAEPNTGTNTGDDTTGPRLDYRVDFEQAGTYYVWVRVRSDTNVDDSVHVGLDGTIVSDGRWGMWHGNYGDWGWADEVDGRSSPDRVTVVVSDLGVHTVNLWMREDGVAVDKVILTTDAGYTPTGAAADGR